MTLSDAHMLLIYTRAKLAYDYKTMQLALIIELASCCNSPEKPIIQTKHLIITVFAEIIKPYQTIKIKIILAIIMEKGNTVIPSKKLFLTDLGLSNQNMTII